MNVLKGWLIRSSSTRIFIVITLLTLIIAALISSIGISLTSPTEFVALLKLATPWLLPIRMIAYGTTGYWWWKYTTQLISNCETAELAAKEKRARNRITLTGILYMAMAEYICWSWASQGIPAP